MAYAFVVRHGSLAPRCHNGHCPPNPNDTTNTSTASTSSTPTDSPGSPDTSGGSNSVTTPSTTESNTSATADGQTPPTISSTPSPIETVTTDILTPYILPTTTSPTASSTITASSTTTSTLIPIPSFSTSKLSISAVNTHPMTHSTHSSSILSTLPNHASTSTLPGTSNVNVTETQSDGSSAISTNSTIGGNPNLHTSGSKSSTPNKGVIVAISSIIVFIILIILIKIALRRPHPKDFDKVDEAEEEGGEIPTKSRSRSAEFIGYNISDDDSGYIIYCDHPSPSSSLSLKPCGSDVSYGTYCESPIMGYHGFTDIQVSNGVAQTNFQAKGGRDGKQAEGNPIGEFDSSSTVDVHSTQDHAGTVVVFKRDDSDSNTDDIDGSESNRRDFVSPSSTTFYFDFTGPPSTVQQNLLSPPPPPSLSLDNSTPTLSNPFNYYRSDFSNSNSLLEDPKLGKGGMIREDVTAVRTHPILSSDYFLLLEAAGLDFQDLGQTSAPIVSPKTFSSRESPSAVY
ncbi:hypothetical protein C8Q75DRAFT_71696 [Abortiporus biennis]|nr:hypothetical protein C8Q75DRAFT_71696 [Abortiporus biennis]